MIIHIEKSGRKTREPRAGSGSRRLLSARTAADGTTRGGQPRIDHVVVDLQDDGEELRRSLYVDSDSRQAEGEGTLQSLGDGHLGGSDDPPPQLLFREDCEVVATGDDEGDGVVAVHVQSHLASSSDNSLCKHRSERPEPGEMTTTGAT